MLGDQSFPIGVFKAMISNVSIGEHLLRLTAVFTLVVIVVGVIPGTSQQLSNGTATSDTVLV